MKAAETVGLTGVKINVTLFDFESRPVESVEDLGPDVTNEGGEDVFEDEADTAMVEDGLTEVIAEGSTSSSESVAVIVSSTESGTEAKIEVASGVGFQSG